jgi:mycothiol S-conjugate amidase
MNTETTRSDQGRKADLTKYGIDSHWLTENKPARRALLAVFAHPDDESFGPGATLARYATTGVAVHYACATRGEVGEVEPALLDGYKDLGELRTAELDCASRALGLRAVHYLGYRDSGMPGTADNRHPNAFAAASLERVTGQVVALIRALRPQVVITFNPFGGYGHPDHIQAHQAAVAAFKQAGDPACYPEQLEAGLEVWSPLKLYYTTFPTTLLKIGVPALRLFGKDPRRMGQNQDVDFVETAAQTTPVTTVLNCADYIHYKETAWDCHKSQAGPSANYKRLPVAVRKLMFGRETFTRAIPPWREGEKREHEMFAGIGF